MNNFAKDLDQMELPEIHSSDGKEYFLDPVRKKLILKTPEEVIRQKMIQYIMKILGVPDKLIQVEMLLSKYGADSQKRADIIVEKYARDENTVSPLAVIECKAPDIMIEDDQIAQVCQYADLIGADYVAVTNGTDLITGRYDAKLHQYLDLFSIPCYLDMLNGSGEPLPQYQEKERFSFSELQANQDYYCGYEFHPDTPVSFRSFLTNLWECFLDTSHKLPLGQYQIFTLLEDYGIRYLTCGNASGGSYSGAYRSFLVKYKEKTMFLNLSFFDYGTSTILTVSSDDNHHKPHNALQYSINRNLEKSGETYYFFHTGRIAVGKIGSASTAGLKQLLEEEYPCIMKNGRVFLGALHQDKLFYLDTPQITVFVEHLLSYALIRDEYREQIKKKQI